MAIVAFLPSANIFNWTVIWTSKSFQHRFFFVVVICLSPMSLSRSQSSNLRWVHIRPDSVDFHRQALEFEIEPFRLCSPDRFHLRSHCCCLQRLSAPLGGFFFVFDAGSTSALFHIFEERYSMTELDIIFVRLCCCLMVLSSCVRVSLSKVKQN